ncbi:MAG: hypothetical protein ACREJX_18720, partial [Polyangiaceae bacterium]
MSTDDAASPRDSGAGTSTDSGTARPTTWGSVGGSDYVGCAVGPSGVSCWREGASTGDYGAPSLIDGTSGVTHFITEGGYTDFLADGGSQEGAHYVAADGAGNLVTDSFTPVTLANIVRLAANDSDEGHACAIDTAGSVSCWGANDEGELGTGDKNDVSGTHTVTLSAKAIDVSAAMHGSCALLQGGEVDCWGDGASAGSLSPAKIDFGSDTAVALASNVSGEEVACAVMQSGKVQCWGDTVSWGMGTQTGPMIHVDHLQNSVSVTISGLNFVCGLGNTGDVACLNIGGGVVDPTFPEPLADIQAGYNSFVARGNSGAVYR